MASEFQVTFGGATFDQSDLPPFSYFSESFTMTATSSSTLLQFGFRDDNGFLNLDDVSVSAVPEPGSLVLLCLGASVLLAANLKVLSSYLCLNLRLVFQNLIS